MRNAGAVLDAMAAKVYRLGDHAGAGSKVKVINQLLAGVHIAAAAEAMALGLREGVDPAALYEVITHSAGNSWMFENRMAHVLAGDYTPLSAVDIFVKDLGLVLDLARASKFPLPLSSTAHQMFMQASSAGFAKEDDSAVIKIFPGIELPPPNGPVLSKDSNHEHSHHLRLRLGAGPGALSVGAQILLGCIADDFTGATDLANNLVRGGMRAVQTIGVPLAAARRPRRRGGGRAQVAHHHAGTKPCTQSLAALRWLQAQGARQIYFKYCSTFDSTAQGNIGPVTEALMDALDTDFTIATPAFPDNQRTVFKGHLFVGDVLLNDSGMRDHPLTPMTDSNLVRVLQAQCRRKVGLIDYRAVAAGEAAMRARIAQLRAEGCRHRHRRCARQRRPAAPGSGAQGHAAGHGGFGRRDRPASQFRHRRLRLPRAALPAAGGAQAVVSGSCSAATNRQVQAFMAAAARRWRSIRCGSPQATTWPPRRWPGRRRCCPQGPVLVYSTAQAEAVKAVQGRLGAQQAGAMVEQAIAAIARGLVELGVRQLVVAGGETSGACVQALGDRPTADRPADRRRACLGAGAATARAGPCTSR